MTRPVGIVGIGIMGTAMMRNLLRDGGHWINARNIAVDGLEQPYAPLDRRPF